MYLYLRCCVAVLIVGTTLVQQPASKSQESADTIELSRLETVWNDAYISGAADALDHLWADDLIVTMTDMSVMTKPKAIGLLRSAHMRFPRYETSDIRIRVYGDAAVVTGRLQRTRNVNGQNVEDDWRFTKVYIRRSDRWLVVAWHASTSARL